MPITYYRKHDRFLARMIDDYRHGEFPERDTFQTYFNWKENKIDLMGISAAAAHDMLDVCSQLLERYKNQHMEAITPPSLSLPFDVIPFGEVPIANVQVQPSGEDAADASEHLHSDDPWASYRSYGDNCYIISYLETIQSDLRTILPLLERAASE